MGPKKTVQNQPKKQIKSIGLTISNKLRHLKFYDGSTLTINDTLISKYSNKLRKQIQLFKGDQILQIAQFIDRNTFKYIQQFFNIRKDKDIPPIYFPIKSNINLRYIMDQNDVILLEKIDKEGGIPLINKLLEISTFLQIQQFRKRLFCLIAIKLTSTTLDQLKNKYQIPSNIQTIQDQLKSQTKNILEQIKKNIEINKKNTQKKIQQE